MDGVTVPRAIRRGPAALLVAAFVVLLVAVLGAAGVLHAPSATAGATPVVNPITSAVGQLVLANGALAASLDQPAQDAASPVSEEVAVPTVTVADSTVLPPDSGVGMRVVYAITGQRVWLVGSDGTVTRTYRVSGRLDRPLPGEYQVYSRSRNTTSYTGDETMEYMVRFAHGEQAAIGFHDIPVDAAGVEVQTVAQLGQPLSAGCVRQALEDAIALWDFAPVGTKVVVLA